MIVMRNAELNNVLLIELNISITQRNDKRDSTLHDHERKVK